MPELNRAERRRRLINFIWINLAVVVVVLLLLTLAFKGVRIPCLFFELTGLQCPGCGNCRAAMAIAHLDFVTAFKVNPFFLPEFFYIGWVYLFSAINYMKSGRFSYRSPSKIFDICMLATVLIWWVVRNLL